MLNLQDILKDRIEAFKKNPELAAKKIGSDYNKSWNKGVQFFQLEINKDRKREKRPEVEFMAVRQKLVALKEIDDLRWFFFHCKKYSRTKDKLGNKNSFSKCFFGALK